MSSLSAQTQAITFRTTDTEDGEKLWRLVKSAGNMDLNSAYCYLLLSSYFSRTCLLAERQGKPVGFVSAFLRPEHTSRLFVWQIVVDKACRGQGVGAGLLDQLVENNPKARYLEATVAPSNQASRALFAKFAAKRNLPLKEEPAFTSEHFPEGAHEDEPLLRIGPIR